jgi:23S rRNA (uracil1939-C5)-methyltransferase
MSSSVVPPRGGTTEELIEHIASLNPKKVVYISCNPQTLARDMAIFKKFGYVGNAVTPFDLFPMTGHVESVVCLERSAKH